MSFWYEIWCDNIAYTKSNHVIMYFTAQKSTKLEPSFGLVFVLQFYFTEYFVIGYSTSVQITTNRSNCF